MGHQQVHPSVVIVIADGNTHGRLRPTVPAHGAAGLHADLFKRPVTPVAPEVVRYGIVGYEDVRETVVIKVAPDDSEPVCPVGVPNTHVVRNLPKLPAAVVVIEEVRQARQTLRAAGHVNSSVLAIVGGSGAGNSLAVKIHVARDVEIEPAIAVIVAPGATGAPIAPFQRGVPRDVGQGSVAVVMEESVGSEVRDQNIGVTVIVIIGGRDAHTPALVHQAALPSNI